MTTGELYSWIGVAGYEHHGCWRKEEKFGSSTNEVRGFTRMT